MRSCSRRRRRLAPIVACGLSLAAAGPALAARTLGANPGDVSLTQNSCSVCEGVQSTTDAGAPSYVVPPVGGVITSWTTRAFTTPGSAWLIVATGSGLNYKPVAESDTRTLAAGELAATKVRIPVSGGEHLGLGVNGIPAIFHFGTTANRVVPLGGVGLPVPVSRRDKGPLPIPAAGGFLLNLSAKVEPDADHDGYGDETQDGCPSDPATHGACPARPGGQTSAGGSTSGPATTGAPLVKLHAPQRESVRHGYLVLVVSSDSDVTADVSGLVKQRRVRVTANSPLQLRLKFSHRELKAIRSRLRQHRKAVATITVVAHNAAGGAATASLRIRLTR